MQNHAIDPDTSEAGKLDYIYQCVHSYYRFNDDNLQQYRDERYFLFVDQWGGGERQAYKDFNKVILTYNKCYEFYKKAVGEQRKNTANVEVRSINGKASQEDITMIADIYRGIEYKSQADIAYQTAFETMFSGGIGAIQVATDYPSPKSWEQEIYIRPVLFPERVGYDPFSISCTKTDGDYMFMYDTMQKEAFKQKYPNVPYPTSFPVDFNVGVFKWGDTDSITVMEFYFKKYFEITVYQLKGRALGVTEEEYEEIEKKYREDLATYKRMHQLEENLKDAMGVPQQQESGDDQQSPMAATPAPASAIPPSASGAVGQPPVQPPGTPPPEIASIFPSKKPEPPEILDKKKALDYKIICYKAIAGHILEEYEWPGKEFPFSMAIGDQVTIDGKTIILAAMRYARDAQRFLNFCISDAAQTIKNRNREQFLATPDNVAGYHQIWNNPSNQVGALMYNPDRVTKAAPIEVKGQEIPASLITMITQSDNDLKSILGYYEAMKGQDGQEVSGVALGAKQRTGNIGLTLPFDNLLRAQEQTARCIMSLIPKIYDTEREVMAKSVDGSRKYVKVNEQVAGDVKNNLQDKEYDIRLIAGPNFAAQKEYALNALMSLAGQDSEVRNLIADLIGKNIEIEDQQELVQRLTFLVPPDALAKSKGEPPPPPQPDPKQQMLQMEQQIAEAKLQLEQERVKVAQQTVELKKEANLIAQQKAQMDIISQRIRASAEVEKAVIDRDAAVAAGKAKVIAAHHDVTKSHHDALKEIYGIDNHIKEVNQNKDQ